ncbi:hypothetical protein P7K49_014967 [Saguinus oedipus]|uniref:Uncharacterized protein n=1 Tax=Saguinus oedipus TaxID=9490 RepID=A0ABQ9V7X1_SAGOE|nr:hypothetical protein P7K49_014967 [Saguinus oedipus]
MPDTCLRMPNPDGQEVTVMPWSQSCFSGLTPCFAGNIAFRWLAPKFLVASQPHLQEDKIKRASTKRMVLVYPSFEEQQKPSRRRT